MLLFKSKLSIHSFKEKNTKSTPLFYFLSFPLPQCLQDPSRRGSSHSFRLLVPGGRPHHRGSPDTSVSPVQRRWPPGRWRHAGGGGHKAPGGRGGSLSGHTVCPSASCFLTSGCKKCKISEGSRIKTVYSDSEWCFNFFFFSISALLHVQFMFLNQANAFIWHNT